MGRARRINNQTHEQRMRMASKVFAYLIIGGSALMGAMIASAFWFIFS